MARKSTRRDFLRGKSAADAAADAVGDALPGKPSQGPAGRRADDAYVIRVTREAMACQFEVRLNAGQYDGGTSIALDALDLVDELEDQLSVFRETSEVSQINRAAAGQPVEVEPGLFGLLELAARVHRETDGAFDITSTPLWEAWGFARRQGAVPDERQLAEALRRAGSQWIELDARHRTVRFRKPGVQINLGAVGKGYALDRCAERLVEHGIHDFLIHGGQSSVLASGRQRSPGDEAAGDHLPPWWVGVRHPLRGDRRLAEIRLDGRALATSGSHAQSFTHKGRRYSHILDPRTGQPAEGVLSATAIAPTATMADALSTAFFVMGPAGTLAYCQGRPELAAVLVCPVRHSGGIEIKTTGLADEDLVLQ